MSRPFLPLLVALSLGIAAAPAMAGGLHFDNSQCNYHTNYDVSVTDAGVRFERASGTPTKVFMHDGDLRVDGHAVAVSAADARSLRQYEADVRQALPEIAGIARAGVDIGFSAMTTVAATFAQDGDQRKRVMDRLNRRHAEALRDIDNTLGRGEWRQDALSDVIESTVEGAIPELVSTVTAGAVKAALSGDQTQMAALQARADALDKSIDKQVDERSDKLQARADGLCARFAAMDTLQQQWQFRLSDGSRLQLLHKEPAHPHHKSDPAGQTGGETVAAH